jgi:hypothetical protein
VLLDPGLDVLLVVMEHQELAVHREGSGTSGISGSSGLAEVEHQELVVPGVSGQADK